MLPKKARQHPGGMIIFFLYPDRTRDFRFNCIIFGKFSQLKIRVFFGITIDGFDVRHSNCRTLKLFHF